MVKFSEIPLQLGRDGGLSSMLALPAEFDSSGPVFVILNAGLLHRIGPFRLHVQLSRQLAQHGIPALRLDLSGLGYSPKHPTLQGLEAALSEINLVFDYLRKTYSLTRPVLLGSCSGAAMSHRIAVNDERVRGAVMLDGYAYPNMQSAIRYYAARVYRPEIWGEWISKRLHPSPKDGQLGDDDAEFWDAEVPSPEQFRAELGVHLDRSTALLFVYSGSVREYNYERQLFDVFPETRERQVAVRYFPRSDHNYLLERDRRALLETICDWATTDLASAGDPPGEVISAD